MAEKRSVGHTSSQGSLVNLLSCIIQLLTYLLGYAWLLHPRLLVIVVNELAYDFLCSIRISARLLLSLRLFCIAELDDTISPSIQRTR